MVHCYHGCYQAAQIVVLCGPRIAAFTERIERQGSQNGPKHP